MPTEWMSNSPQSPNMERGRDSRELADRRKAQAEELHARTRNCVGNGDVETSEELL